MSPEIPDGHHAWESQEMELQIDTIWIRTLQGSVCMR